MPAGHLPPPAWSVFSASLTFWRDHRATSNSKTALRTFPFGPMSGTLPLMVERIVFLPGASGDRGFWRPVSKCIPTPADHVLVGWPGFADTPFDPSVKCLADLVSIVDRHLDRPAALVAQSMGGVVAILAALRGEPNIRRLVLTATSGGIDMRPFRPHDWKKDYLRDMPRAPTWFVDDHSDLTDQLPDIEIPTLLLFGDADPIAPVAVGRFLESRLLSARLVTIEGGGHRMAKVSPEVIACHVREFLES